MEQFDSSEEASSRVLEQQQRNDEQQCPSCAAELSLGRTAEALRAIIGSKSAISLQRGPVDPKFKVLHSSSQKTRINVLSYDIKI